MISFSGIDGSGKTTLAERTSDYLSSKNIASQKIEVYNRSLFINLGKIAGRVSKSMKHDLESGFRSDDKKAKTKLGWLRCLCFRIDILIFALTSSIMKIRGVLPVCDRYLYDGLIHLRYLGVINEREYNNLLKRIPKPVLPIILTLNEERAIQREGKHSSIEYYKNKIALYKRLADNEGLVIIDSSSDIDDIWKNLKSVINSKIGIR